jgi:hypothetical protein
VSLRDEVWAEMSKGLEANPLVLRLIVEAGEGEKAEIPAEEFLATFVMWADGVVRGVLYLADKVEELTADS